MGVSEEKIQECSPSSPSPENAQTLTGVVFRAAGKSVNNFPAASKFAGKLFQQGISKSHSLLEHVAIAVELRCKWAFITICDKIR